MSRECRTACDSTGSHVCTECRWPELCNPPVEVCNGEDDDCSGVPDDGDAVASCEPVRNGTVGCIRGACRIAECNEGWADANLDIEDGCETETDPYPNICPSATDLGEIPDDGSFVDVTGTIAPVGDVDWITFTAIDGPDGEDGICDTFHLNIRFLSNPGDVYAMEVRRGECAVEAECGADPIGSYDYFTDFRRDLDLGDGIRGECPCSPAPGRPGTNFCTDNGSVYMVRIFRTDGGMASAEYTLRVSNP